ncbi:geranylgeranyl transferase type-1 subunit beta [Ischnura elegans]|uniref:geranylgeranyl transferase type-1 subunit beta n=1 Tax=Ischnura elegans TaxID=197161 RepID=UPI001ED88C98|nr:geranylgeranyl transferase type-1 subunit beta [Ischnura elegans]
MLSPMKSDMKLAKNQHVKYLLRHLKLLPSLASSYDSTRLAVAFFCISGLDVLKSLDVLDEEKKKSIIDWIYGLLVEPKNAESGQGWERCGFQGSSTFNFACDGPQDESCPYKSGHLAMTYTGLATLLILGDDLSRVNRKALSAGVRALQQENGSFCASLEGSENDMRFVYCAASICYMIKDWSGMDVQKTINYILESISYDYGIGQGPGLEAHGGTTFCAVAALSLMGQLEGNLSEKQIDGLKRWCIYRQISGFQGRPNKPVDTCYSFWVGATLKLLGIFHLVDYQQNKDYLLSTQDPITGGFSKWVDSSPDAMHTYLGLCGLALMSESDLEEVHAGLNMSQRALKHLHGLHKKWDQ